MIPGWSQFDVCFALTMHGVLWFLNSFPFQWLWLPFRSALLRLPKVTGPWADAALQNATCFHARSKSRPPWLHL